MHTHVLWWHCATGAHALAQLLETDTTLTIVNVRDNNINVAACTAICTSLHAHSCLTVLHLSNNRIDSEGGAALADVLKVCRQLRESAEVEIRGARYSRLFLRCHGDGLDPSHGAQSAPL